MKIENVLGMREKFPVVMELWRELPHYYTTEFTVYGHDFTLMRKARLFLLLHRQPFTFPSLDCFPTRHEIPLPILLAGPGRRLQDYLEDSTAMDERSRNDTLITPYIRTRVQGGYQRPSHLYDPAQQTPINLPTNYGEIAAWQWSKIQPRPLATVHFLIVSWRDCTVFLTRISSVEGKMLASHRSLMQ